MQHTHYTEMVHRMAREALATLDPSVVTQILEASVRALAAHKAKHPSLFDPGKKFTGHGQTTYFWMHRNDLLTSSCLRRAAEKCLIRNQIRIQEWPEKQPSYAHGAYIVSEDIAACICSTVLCQPYDTIYTLDYRPEFDDYV